MNAEEKYVLKLNNHQKRVEVTSLEMMLLKELAVHRIMDNQDVHHFLNAGLTVPKTKSSISNRLKRLVDSGVLVRNEVRGTNLPLYFYKLGKKGVQLLVAHGFISSEKEGNLYVSITKTKPPKIHNSSVSKVATHVRVLGLSEGFLDYEHNKGSDDQLNLMVRTHDNLIIIPDWIFKRRDTFIYVEMDSGHQRSKSILQKVMRYIEFAQAENQRQIIVIFSVIDKSVNSAAREINRSKRVSSLKGSIPSCLDWPSNLSFYVITAERTSELIIRLLKGIEPVSQSLRDILVNEWYLKFVSFTKSSRLKELDIDLFYPNMQTPKELQVDFVFEWSEGDMKRNIGLIFVEEGACASVQKVALNHRRTLGQYALTHNLNELILIYSSLDQAENDVYGLNLKNTWISHMDEWNISKKTKQISMLKMISNYRKEEAYFE